MPLATAQPTGLSAAWIIFRTCVEERLVYRGDFALGTLMRFLPIITQIFLWTAVYASAGGSIGGFTRNDVIAYYLLTMLGRAFSSMPGLASGIAGQIRTGEIKVVYYAVAAAPFALVFWLCGDYFPEKWPDATTWTAFLLSLVMSFALGFYLEALLGMIGFWFLEVSSLLFVYMLANFFFSGHMFPLDFLTDSVPGWVAWLLWFQPLKFLAYFPAAVYLGKIHGPELWQNMVLLAVWIVFFYVAARVALQRGLKRYSGFGG
jgi:ABC-2 type transport system permease protein